MITQVAGFPYWEAQFDGTAALMEPSAVDAFLQELWAQQLTDLFVFSHGWNNDLPTARSLYRRFFEQIRDVLDRVNRSAPQRPATIGIVGVIWPSMRWIDEELPSETRAAA